MSIIKSRPDLEATHPDETKSGLNEIVMGTIHYGNQPMIFEKDVPIKMRDGITLYVNIFRPNCTGKFPVVMSMDPYNKDALPPWQIFHRFWPSVGSIETSQYAPIESPDPGYWVPNGYVLIKIATRGSSNSEGALYPWSKTETEDYYEVIEWAAKQEWSDGNIGLNGVSYLAMTQWRVAALNPPHLKAIIPWEGTSDLYREWYFHGGIPETAFSSSFEALNRERWPKNEIEPMVEEQKAHPLIDEHWKKREVDLSNITVPMLVCASWSTQGLHCRGTFEGFKKASSKDKWLLVHGRKEWETYYLRESLEQQKAFFDYFLKGIENGWRNTAPIRYEVRERFYQGYERCAAQWPLENTKYTEFYLSDEEMTLEETSQSNEIMLTYNSEAAAVENNQVSFKFTAKEDIEITGYSKLRLWVSAEDTDDMDIFIGLKKLDIHGNEVLLPDFNQIEYGIVAHGWLRASHRELDLEKSTIYQPVLKHTNLAKLNKGEVVPVEIEIWPFSIHLNNGESLELVIKGSEIVTEDVVGVARGYAHTDTVNKGRHSIYLGGKYNSHLLLPIVPNK